jgi:hypothetical protein
VRGVVRELLGKRRKHGKEKTRTVRLPTVRATLKAGVPRTLQLRLGPAVLSALERRIRASGTFTLTADSAGAATSVKAYGRLRL